MSHKFSQAAKTVDFGANGYTGSVGDWHFLLQVTAPDPRCGMVYTRGNFPDHADSILDRAQTESGRGSWGFRICEDSEIRLGEYQSQGLLNYRWPCFAYSITGPSTTGTRRPSTTRPSMTAIETEQERVGSLHTCSFVKDGTVFQIVVIRHRYQTKAKVRRKLKFRIGGAVRFGCVCRNGAYTGRSGPSLNSHNQRPTPNPATLDNFTWTAQGQEDQGQDKLMYYLQSRENGKVRSARCENNRYNDVRLDMQLFINDKGVIMEETSEARGQAYIDLSTTQELDFEDGDQLVITGTFSLNATGSERHKFLERTPSCAEIEDYLGIVATSEASTGKLWVEEQNPWDSSEDKTESHTVARCVERIIGVSMVPSVGPDAMALPPSGHTSQRSSFANSDTAALPTNIKLSSLAGADSSSLADLEAALGSATSVVANTSHKDAVILDNCLSSGSGTALVANIMTQQYSDLQNML